MQRVLLAIAVLGACGDDAGVVIDGPPGHERIDDAPPPMFDPLVGIGTVELVDDGYMFLEGPQWREATGDLVFSDIPANTIYRMAPDDTPVVHVMPSQNSNGLALDGAGALVAAHHGSRSVSRDGTDIASTFEGKPLNSPNDVVVADDGTIYFTDPPYALPSTGPRQGFMGVYRLSGSMLTAEHRGAESERPNGIGLSPDGTSLYVADTDAGTLYRFPVLTGGALGAREVLADTTVGADGLAIDTGGNIFVTTSAGIEVFAPDGAMWGRIDVPMPPANCAFGDADHKTLYITARTSLYRVRLANAGLPTR